MQNRLFLDRNRSRVALVARRAAAEVAEAVAEYECRKMNESLFPFPSSVESGCVWRFVSFRCILFYSVVFSEFIEFYFFLCLIHL